MSNLTGELVQRPLRIRFWLLGVVCGAFAEPSDGLEPSTPSLPSPLRSASRSQPADKCQSPLRRDPRYRTRSPEATRRRG